jgi:hypothetical protein
MAIGSTATTFITEPVAGHRYSADFDEGSLATGAGQPLNAFPGLEIRCRQRVAPTGKADLVAASQARATMAHRRWFVTEISASSLLFSAAHERTQHLVSPVAWPPHFARAVAGAVINPTSGTRAVP